MPVLQIDKNGNIRGTKNKYVMKVLTLQSILIKGKRIAKGEQIVLEGNDLSFFLNRNMVVPVKEDSVITAPHTLETDSQPALVKSKKKLGPKKKKEEDKE